MCKPLHHMKKTPILSPPTAGESPAIHPIFRRTSSSSAVPFSWEHEPGIPKNPGIHNLKSNPDRIPPPPPIRFNFVKTRSEVDPFAVALAECVKETPLADPELEEFLRRGSAAGESRRRRTAAWFAGGGFGLLGFRVSCKAVSAACSVADCTVRVPRTGPVNRRIG